MGSTWSAIQRIKDVGSIPAASTGEERCLCMSSPVWNAGEYKKTFKSLKTLNRTATSANKE